MRAALRLLLVMTLVTVAVIEGAAWLHRHRADLPWTELDLRQPAGRFTAAKIAGLGEDPPRCRALLAQAGEPALAAPKVRAGERCGYSDGILLGGSPGPSPAPAGLVTSCPVAAALSLWERDLQMEARRLLGTEVRRFVHAGSFSCRRLYGRSDGPWSEHATADAVDIIGFELADGRSISVLRDWRNGGPAGRFLRAARDGACRSFTTVLSPDYNAAHRDHLHLDTADRAMARGTVCR